jgi:hypothetical protein
MRREAEYISLNPSELEEISDFQNRHVVICVLSPGLEVWQTAIDDSALQGYRHFP